jgi:hypothetical protein
MGRQHIKNGVLSMRRQKTDVAFDIPVLPGLAREIELHPKGQLTFLTTEWGKPFTPAGFGNWFRYRCNEAGLPQCSAHGLRKASAVRHALRGATAPELMAWHGWRSGTLCRGREPDQAGRSGGRQDEQAVIKNLQTADPSLQIATKKLMKSIAERAVALPLFQP